MFAKLIFRFISLPLLAIASIIAQPIEDPYLQLPPPPPQDPTNVNIAQPQNILVVFKRGDQISEGVKDYYVQARNIPTLNIIKDFDGFPGLTIPDTITYDGWARVILFQDGEIIKRDDHCAEYGSNCYDIFTFS